MWDQIEGGKFPFAHFLFMCLYLYLCLLLFLFHCRCRCRYRTRSRGRSRCVLMGLKSILFSLCSAFTELHLASRPASQPAYFLATFVIVISLVCLYFILRLSRLTHNNSCRLKITLKPPLPSLNLLTIR